MNKNLSPFDSDLIYMINNLVKQMPLIIFGEKIIMVKWFSNETLDVNKAIREAIIGRLGERYIDLNSNGHDQEFILTMKYDVENYPREIRTDIIEKDITAGKTYIPIYREIVAIQLLRQNIKDAIAFTGGGIALYPIDGNDIIKYTFVSNDGTFINVYENQYIVLTSDGKFEIMDKIDFDRQFELKNSHNEGNYEDSVNNPINN